MQGSKIWYCNIYGIVFESKWFERIVDKCQLQVLKRAYACSILCHKCLFDVVITLPLSKHDDCSILHSTQRFDAGKTIDACLFCPDMTLSATFGVALKLPLDQSSTRNWRGPRWMVTGCGLCPTSLRKSLPLRSKPAKQVFKQAKVPYQGLELWPT